MKLSIETKDITATFELCDDASLSELTQTLTWISQIAGFTYIHSLDVIKYIPPAED